MITSTANAQVKNIINLIKKSGERKNRGLFVIEGLRIFTETPINLIDKIYVSESFARANKDFLDGYEYELVADKVYEFMSDTKTPQGILATVKRPQYSLEQIMGGERPLIVILEKLQDPGNLGTIIRSALGAGASGIIMSKDTADIFNPKTVRSTMGAMYRLPFVYVDDLIPVMKQLDERKIPTYAAYLEGAKVYYEADYTEAAAILIGNEGNGLSKQIADAASERILIPMQGRLESLNAAVAASVILYEAARQRR